MNKVESGVRLRYQFKTLIPERRKKSWSRIPRHGISLKPGECHAPVALYLYEKELQHRMAEQAKSRPARKNRVGSQIRSYVFDDRRVKDHRTNYQTSDVQGVMDGKIDDFIKAYLMEFAGEENNG